MSAPKKSTTGKPFAAVVVYTIALVMLALPVYEWMSNAWWFYQDGSDRVMMFINLPARLFALVGFLLMFFQFVLGIRNPVVEQVFNRATNLKRHRTLGKISFVLIMLHGLLIMTQDMIFAGRLLFDVYRVLGMLALLLLTAGVVAAWFYKPLKLSRTVWRRIHLTGYIVFPLGFIHSTNLGTEPATGRYTVYYLFSLWLVVYSILVVWKLYSVVRGARHRPCNSSEHGV